jgi:Fe-S-cluster-containing hydrogenase component 2
MTNGPWHISDKLVIPSSQLDEILARLTQAGFKLLGPTVRDGAIVYDTIAKAADLPVGWTDDQERATYCLKSEGDGSLFNFTVGPDSWKKHLHPPRIRLWEAQREDQSIRFAPPKDGIAKTAFIGVRACELAAIAVQDKVFLDGPYVDLAYKARREACFIVAVNCGKGGGTCFCVSMKTGPQVASGFDIALTEILRDGRHDLVVEIGTKRAAKILGDLAARSADAKDLAAVKAVVEKAASEVGRSLETENLHDALMNRRESPHWDNVAGRCLCCTNCTLVCPTCFCTTVADGASLGNALAFRDRRWDSCFTHEFSYVHGGVVRQSARSRYRHWITHKLATWIDQFGVVGCVGCGRCITWCPAQIDITEEAKQIQAETTGEPRAYAEGV